MSYSQPWDLPKVSELVSPVLPVARLETPYASVGSTSLIGTFTRIAQLSFGPLPHGGILYTRFGPSRPHSSRREVFPCRPASHGNYLLGRSRRLVLLSPHLQREKEKILLSTAPIERGEHVSAYHALRRSALTGGKIRPLSCGWWPQYSG